MPDDDDGLMVGGELVLSGYVGDDWMDDGFTYPEVVRALSRLQGRDVTVRLNSGGGIATDGQAIHAALVGYPGRITVRIEGIAASAASLIAMAGDRIEMTPGSMMMIHDPAGMTFGTAAWHASRAEMLNALAEGYAQIYAGRSGLPPERIREMMVAETWFTPDEAVAAGLADAAPADAIPAEVAAFDFAIYARAPDHLVTLAKTKGWRFRRPDARAGEAASKEVDMTVKTEAADPKPAEATPRVDKVAPPAPAADAAVEAKSVSEERTAIPDASAITMAERTRIRRITDTVAMAGLPASMAHQLIDAGASIEQAVTAVLDRKAEEDMKMHGAGRGRAVVTRDERDTKRMAIEAALHANLRRCDPDTDAARPYMGMTIVQMAAEAAGWAGPLRTVGEREEAFRMAMHSASDFPAIFENVLNKTLLEQYEAAAPTYRTIARRVTFNDFRAHPMVRVGDYPALQEITETGEIKFGTVGETKETAILKSYAAGLAVSRQMIVNDELGAIEQVMSDYGARVAYHEEETFFAFMASATLADTDAVWLAGRGNLAGSGTAITVAAVGAGRAAMRKQTSIGGKKLNLAPSILLVSPDKETEADQLVTGITPSKKDEVNPFSGRLTVVTAAELTGNAWYLFADPARPGGACFAYGYLSGQEAPRVRIEEPFGRQGTAMTVEHDFGVGAIDYRGAYKNPGA